jgi:hypothetical protein
VLLPAWATGSQRSGSALVALPVQAATLDSLEDATDVLDIVATQGGLMILKREPVLIQTAILAILNLLVVFDALHLTDVQLGAVNAALAAVLGLIVRQQVTPLANPKNAAGQPLGLVPKP